MTTRVTLARRATTPFAPHFTSRHPDFWPLARAARTFASETDWPAVEAYARAFAGVAPVRFELSVPKPRRARRRDAPLDRSSMYDAQIVRGVVPTRARDWHDYANALVWATFPRAKQALHARQHRAVAAWIPDGAVRLPGARTREMDGLALVDEGGVVQVGEASIVFGHALYEGAALTQAEHGVRRVVAREVLQLESRSNETTAELLARVDAALVALMGEASLVPERFPSARRVFCSHEGAGY